MFLPLQITLRNVPHSEELDEVIRRRAEGLQDLQQLTSCRVVVERVGHQGPLFAVRIDLKMAGSEIAVDHQHNRDLRIAVRDAFDAARRQLEDRIRLGRGDVKAHT